MRFPRLFAALRHFLTEGGTLDLLKPNGGGSEAVVAMGGRKAVLSHARKVARIYRQYRAATAA